jgi:hypothetical protein
MGVGVNTLWVQTSLELAPKYACTVQQARNVIIANAKVCCGVYTFVAEVVRYPHLPPLLVGQFSGGTIQWLFSLTSTILRCFICIRVFL